MSNEIGTIIGKKYGMLVVSAGERAYGDKMIEVITQLVDKKPSCYAPKCELARLTGSLWCSVHRKIEVFAQLDDKIGTDKLRNN